MQIKDHSFYWFVPPMFSLVIILLFRLRACTSSRYTTTGFLLIYCAIGNSIYFFGRSHENNIINISIVLLFVFFLMLDLIARLFQAGNKAASPSLLCRHGVEAMAFSLIAVIIIWYSPNIVRKVAIQIQNIKKDQPIYPPAVDSRPSKGYLDRLRETTGNSRQVYFIDISDFKFYYYGGYTPIGYCNPFWTWLFTSDLNRFLQGLLDNGYYLVCNGELKYLLANLQYNNTSDIDQNVVVSKITTQTKNP